TSGLSVRIGGGALAGTPGHSITEIYWSWGDGSNEVHAFPNTHTYAGSGTYVVLVRVTQSDGQVTEKSTVVTVTNPTPVTTVTTSAQTTSPPSTVPTTTETPVGPPIIALAQPSVENQTVVIGGSVLPGGPGVTVDAIEWDWGDRTRIRSNEIPAMHTYLAAGSYTITVTVFQSDGQTATTTFDIGIIQVPGTYVTTGTPMPNGSGWPIPAVRLYGINILPLILLLVVGLIAGGLLYTRNREKDAPGIPTTEAIEQAAAAYHEAKQHGDLPGAKRYALDAARLLVIQAEAVPRFRDAYLEKAEIWKEIARAIDDRPPEAVPDPVTVPEPVPLGALIPESAVLSQGAATERSDEPPLEGGALLAGTDVEPAVFDAVLRIALEIAREGREGKPVGTAFLVGDLEGVLAYSTQFILNPFKGHTTEERRITNEELAENIKEFAQLDGAFVISGDGLVEAAGRYITVDTSAVQIPPGLGSRHASVAGITLVTRAIGIVVSQSGGLIKVFRNGSIVRTVSPW
ncbi:MAG TPA: diadenylate cyclase, partial [Methanoregulaceae archaeon]|nr:diadenylate cyclase [Methanoregulaceae archaeon]